MGPLGCMRAIPPEGYPPFSKGFGVTKGGIAPGGVAFQGLRCSKWVGTCLQNPGPISENGFPRQGSYDTTHPACLQGPEGPAWGHGQVADQRLIYFNRDLLYPSLLHPLGGYFLVEAALSIFL